MVAAPSSAIPKDGWPAVICLSRGQRGQQKIGLVPIASVKRIRAGKQFWRTIGRVVVSEPSNAPKWAGRSDPLKILPLNSERQTGSFGQRETHRPDLQINLVDLAWLKGLSFVMGIIRKVFRGAQQIQFALRNSQPALRDR